MRVVCATQPAPGHFLPTSRLLRAMVARGDEVTVVSSPAFGDFVRRLGLPFQPVGPAWLAAEVAPRAFAVGESPTGHADHSFADAMTRQSLLAGSDLLAELKPDLLVREPTEFGVSFAAELAGIPTSTVGIGFFRSGERLMNDGGQLLLALRSEIGLPAGVADLDGLSRRRYIQTTPPSFETVPGALTPMRTVEIPAGTRSAGTEPRILVTLGTLVAGEGRLARLLDELARIPVPCVLAAGDRYASVAASVPPHVQVHGFTDLATLAAGCTALVCHGGFGSMLTAFAYQLPIVVVPYNADQEWNAAQVVRSGSGYRVGWEQFGTGQLAAAVERVHTAPVRRAARRVAGELAQFPPPHRVADLIAADLDGAAGPRPL